MLKNLSSRDVTWVLNQLGITFKRHGKEDVFDGLYNGRTRVVILKCCSKFDSILVKAYKT
ncbi:MAG: hypothetical protein U9R02_03585 [Thermodesulfobacteriota bacterium]|nr:hypothetical protein [Thermodesulfobacteriota bacterium]